MILAGMHPAYLLRPDFMQAMLVVSLLFLLPLDKRRYWGLRFFGVTVVFLLLYLIVGQWSIAQGWTPLTMIAYYGMPLLAGLLVFLLCGQGPPQDAFFGLGCAYAVQHIAFCVTVILWGEQAVQDIPSLVNVWLVHLAIFGLCWLLFARSLVIRGSYHVGWHKALLHVGMVIFAAMILNRVVRELYDNADPTAYAICMTYDLCFCLALLFLQREQRREIDLQADVEEERSLRLRAQERYKSSRENIDILNRRCHTLKQQIAALRLAHSAQERERTLQEMEQDVLLYDTAVQTGNEVLDALLTEKSLLCESSGISWSCMVDATLLGFLPADDLYVLLDGALDNAIQGSKTLRDAERRVVRLTVRRQHGAAFIQVENYFEPSALQNTGQAKDDDTAGSDLHSIRRIAEQYGGTMDVEVGEGNYLLSILIPLSFKR